jgi:radical SAM superfamily enzyme YgiQ (UPF0313 family)
MKLLLVNPCLRVDASYRRLPVGLGYVATMIKEAGFDFDLLDIDVADYDDAYIENFIAKNRYDVIALGSIVTHYAWIKWFIHMVKRYHPGCKVILGNSVGSSIPEIIGRTAPVDVIVLGEGDVTTVEVLKAYNEGRELGRADEPETPILHTNGNYPATIRGTGVEGIVFRDEKDRLVNTGPRKAVRIIDDLPFPDWDLFDVGTYIERSKTAFHKTTLFPSEEAVLMPVNTARGCVFKCTFCHYVFWNDPYRHRSAENVIAEIQRNQRKYGANYINFWDELSFHKLGPTEKFLDAMIEADLGIHWTAAIRSDLFGRPDVPYEDRHRVAQKMKDAGALLVGYSLESGNDEILKAMNKRVESSYFKEQAQIVSDVGMANNTSIVVGYPQETPETIAETMTMLKSAGIYPSVGFLLPLPSTGMWNHAMKHGFIDDPDAFLSDVTERQDLIVNMTTMETSEMVGEVEKWLKDLRTSFGLDLGDGNLIKTGGDHKHTKNQKLKDQNEVNMATAQSSSMNYASATGKM